MTSSARFIVLFLSAWLLPLLLDRQQRSWAETPDAASVEFFETHIRPVLVESCYECHSRQNDAQMGGLRLDDPEAIRAGGDHGPALVPGHPDRSLLIQALRQQDLEMPPDGKLPESTIQYFVQWIEMGAPDPRGAASGPPADLVAAEKDFWAFQRPRMPAMATPESSGWANGNIDRLLLARMEADGLQPVGPADRYALIRRATFDLWGLPPTPEAIEAFVADESPAAFERLVDRLLESPRFGERWGRHWLDIARYAESTGRERNFLYPHAWRYRDYVIDAFNQDKPYDRFVVEQIAGDHLQADHPEQRAEQLTATGFLALGERDLLNGRDEEFQLETAADQINVTTRAILGLTVACARCHDHKFDPIPTRDYYALAGIFLSTETLYGTVPGTGGGNNNQVSGLIPIGERAQDRHERYLAHQEKVEAAVKELGKITGRRKKLLSLPEKTQADRQEELQKVEKEYRQQQEALQRLKESGPTPPGYVMGVRDAEKVDDTAIRVAGNYRDRGEIAPRGVLSCFDGSHRPPIPPETSGRLQLAESLVDPTNPLTARVMANRIWHHLFGRGIVSTVDNFGTTGRPPSHPELLDYLAITFQQDDWSVKRLIRRIMLSRVYQLSAEHNQANYRIDPDNVLLWRRSPRRLEAEAIRDAILSVSGWLQQGPPPVGSVVATIGDGCLVRQVDPERLRVDDPYRSVYMPVVRYFSPPLIEVFDGVSPSLVAGARSVTNVPAQSLFLLNNPFVVEQSQQTALRLLQETDGDDADKVKKLFRWTLGRPPTEQELQQVLAFLADASHPVTAQGQPNGEPQRWAGVCQSLFASAEFRYIY